AVSTNKIQNHPTPYENTIKKRKIVKTEGPIDVSENFYVPFEMFDSTQKLVEAINLRVCVLLVGHFQCGKTSTLRYLRDSNKNHFYVHSTMLLKDGFLRGVCKELSLNLCDNVSDLNYEILKKYKEEVVILIDECDRFLVSCKDADNEIDQIKTLAKCVNDGGVKGIKSIVFAGSFSITTTLIDGIPQIEQIIRISQNEQAHGYFRHPRGIPSPLNSEKTIEASDFTKEQHLLFYHDIQADRNVHFSEEVVDDIFSLTNGHAGLEEFIRNPTRKKINSVNHIEKYLCESDDATQYNNPLIKSARKLLERFLQKGTLQSSEITDEDSISLLHLRAIGIVKSSNGDTLARISSITTPSDFLEKVLGLL
ncbi:1816_t:CDS:2, partial [Dentiscutata erythropus]